MNENIAVIKTTCWSYLLFVAVTYNPRTRQFIFLDTRGITTWDKDGIEHAGKRMVACHRPKRHPRCDRKNVSHWLMYTRSCFIYTVWTFFCSRVLKKVKFFKPLPFPLKIVFGADFVSVFPLNILLHFETDNNIPKRLLFWENWEYLIRENTVWTSFVLRSTLRMLHKNT